MPFLAPLLVGRFGSPTQIDDRKKGTLILKSLLEDLEVLGGSQPSGSKSFCLVFRFFQWRGSTFDPLKVKLLAAGQNTDSPE